MSFHLFGKCLADFGLKDVENIKFSPLISGIYQKLLLKRDKLSATLAKRILDADFEDFTNKIERSYHSHQGKRNNCMDSWSSITLVFTVTEKRCFCICFMATKITE